MTDPITSHLTPASQPSPLSPPAPEQRRAAAERYRTHDRAAPGTVVGGRYTLRAAVGNGGMGTVWQATDNQLGRKVAVKEVVPPPGIAPEDRESMYQRMLREARAAASLSHPGIVQVYDVVTDAGRPWVVMELLDARSLSDMVLQDGPLAPRAVAKIGLALLGALEVAHAAGVLHRDVKPANVLVCTDGRCVLTDFGVARMPSDQQLTTPGMVLGSPHFISPERAMGAPFGPPSDLFSVGVTLYAAVEGRPPFDKGEPIATMHSVVEDQPPPPQRAGPLTEMLYGLLEKDPHRRWDAPAAREKLRELLAGPLASGSVQFPTDPYSVVSTQQLAWQPQQSPAPANSGGQIGGRALLAPDETPRERARPGGHADPYGAVVDPYQQSPDPYAGAGRYRHGGADTGAAELDSTAESPTIGAGPPEVEWSHSEPPTIVAGRGSTRPGPGWDNRSAAADTVTSRSAAGRTAGAGATTGRGGEAVAQARQVAGRAGAMLHQAGARGLATARRAPRRVQIAAAAGLTVLVLVTTVWLVTRGGDARPDEVSGPPPAPELSAEPTPVEPSFEVQTYTGRGMVVNIPADWRAGPDNPDLSYIDFADPADARAQIRLVVDTWGGDAAGLVQVAEETIQANPNCANPYQRIDLTDLELAGRPGALLEYTCGEGEDQRRARWATFVHDGKAYSVRLTVLASTFEEHTAIFDELVQSFGLATD